MGLGWPFSERRGAEEPHGIAETRGGQRQRPIWARGRHAKPGLKEPRTLILRQPPRAANLPKPPSPLSWSGKLPRIYVITRLPTRRAVS